MPLLISCKFYAIFSNAICVWGATNIHQDTAAQSYLSSFPYTCGRDCTCSKNYVEERGDDQMVCSEMNDPLIAYPGDFNSGKLTGYNIIPQERGNAEVLHQEQNHYYCQMSHEYQTPIPYHNANNSRVIDGHYSYIAEQVRQNPVENCSSGTNWQSRDICDPYADAYHINNDLTMKNPVTYLNSSKLDFDTNKAICLSINQDLDYDETEQGTLTPMLDATEMIYKNFCLFYDELHKNEASFRVIINRQFNDMENQSINRHKLGILISHFSSINPNQTTDRTRDAVLKYIKLVDLSFREIKLTEIQGTNSFQTIALCPTESARFSSFCEDVETCYKYYAALIIDADSFANNQQVFLAFILKTVLQLDATFGYVLRPSLWKMQSIMPEFRPYLFSRLAMNQEPEYDKDEGLKYSFINEMECVKDLLKYYYKDYYISTENAIISHIKTVENYRKLIYKMLQAKQYRHLWQFYFYKYGLYAKVLDRMRTVAFATRNMLLMLAFAPHSNCFTSLHNAITDLEKKEAPVVLEDMHKKPKRKKAMFSIFKKMLRYSNRSTYDLHILMLSAIDDIIQLRKSYQSADKTLRIYALFRNETWVITYETCDKLSLLRLSVSEIFVYFFSIAIREFQRNPDTLVQ